MSAQRTYATNEFDSSIERFDASWKSGNVPDINDFLTQGESQALASRREDLLVELVMIDLEYRWRRNLAEESTSHEKRSCSGLPMRSVVEDYVSAFPELGSARDLVKVIASEYRTRHRWGDQPAHHEYQSRFPEHAAALSEALTRVDQRLPRQANGTRLQIRCPHCHVLTDPDALDLAEEIVCSACQRGFRLVPAASGTGHFAGGTLGSLQLCERLGSGSFGTVWKAHDEQLARDVAIKIPHADQLQPEKLEQFLREARTAAQLNHPNIVRIHYVDRAAETVFIVSDLIDGEPLTEWLDGRSLSAREAAELCQAIALALDHAHQAGIVHRDLKPSNILMDRNAHPHLTDFGLARREAGEVTVTRDGQLLGTPAYMSPEQANGESHRADPRSDIYSIGVILYELLTGERPFRGSMRVLLRQITDEDAPSPKKLDSSIPKDLETICLKCLEKSPAKRFPTARDLADELERFLEGRPIHSRPISTLTRGWRWCQRKPAAAIAIGLLLLVATIAPMVAVNQRRAAERYRWKQYTSDMKVALTAWDSGDVERVLTLLRHHLPIGSQKDIRGFEWYYLWRLCRPSETTRAFPTVAPAWVAFSPEGNTLAATGRGMLHLWDLETGRQLHSLEAHTNLAPGLAFSPDGRILATAGWDGRLKLWRLDESNEPEILSAGQPDVLDGHKFFDLAFSPDGKFLASDGPHGGVLLWDIGQRKIVKQLRGHKSDVWYLAFGGNDLLAAGWYDGKVGLWNVETGQRREFPGHEPGTTCVAFSTDNTILISGGEDNLIKLWDLARGELSSTLRGHTNQVYTVVCSPNGDILASASRDGTVRFWSMQTRTEIAALRGFGGHVLDVAFSPDGQKLAAIGADGKVKLWGVAAVTQKRTFEGTRVEFSEQDSELLVWNGGTLKVWDPAALELIPDPANSRDRCVGRSPDGRYLALGHPDGSVEVLSVATGDRRKLAIWSEEAAGSVQFSPDGKYLASTNDSASTEERRLKLWDLTMSTELVDLAFVRTMALSPDWRVIATCSREAGDFTVRLWDRTGKELATISQQAPVFSFDFSADGAMLAVGTWKGDIQLYNVATPKQPFSSRTLRGHVGVVEAVNFGPYGRRLASGGRDRTIKLWDLSTGDEMISLKGHRRRVTSVAFSPNGRTLVSASEDEPREVLAGSEPKGSGSHCLVVQVQASRI